LFYFTLLRGDVGVGGEVRVEESLVRVRKAEFLIAFPIVYPLCDESALKMMSFEIRFKASLEIKVGP
jgi:hypothetical protein